MKVRYQVPGTGILPPVSVAIFAFGAVLIKVSVFFSGRQAEMGREMVFLLLSFFGLWPSSLF